MLREEWKAEHLFSSLVFNRFRLLHLDLLQLHLQQLAIAP